MSKNDSAFVRSVVERGYAGGSEKSDVIAEIECDQEARLRTGFQYSRFSIKSLLTPIPQT